MKRAACLLAFTHLTVAAVTICHGSGPVLRGGWWVKPLMLYGGVSYAIWRFGFFSPDVGKSTEVEITVQGVGGDVERLSTLHGFRFFSSNDETMNRFYVFKLTCAPQNLQDLCARSVATHMMNLYSNAARVDFAMRSIRYPSMDEYLAGAPVSKVEFYSTTFVLPDRAAVAVSARAATATHAP